LGSRIAIALLALGGVSHAQEAPTEPAPPPAAPAVPVAPVAPAAPAAEPAPAASTTKKSEPDADIPSAFIVGVGFGIAGATGTPSEIYGPSYGLQIALGIGYGPLSLEGRFGLGYGALPKQAGLRGDQTRGSLTQHSVIIRGQLPVGPASIGAFVGVATGSVPLLTVGLDPDEPGHVDAADVEGIGAMFGASAHIHLSPYLELAAELSLAQMSWDLPDAAYVTNPMSMGNATTFTPSTADVSSTIYAFTIALRGTLTL